MNIQTKLPTTPDEFLRWNEGREGKREFVRGRVVELMINVTRNHWRLASALTHQLTTLLGMEDFNIGSADFGVKTWDGVRFPDVLVESYSPEGKALATNDPLLIAEVLSPSSIADDFGPKVSDYLSLPSLRHYLVLSQEEVRIWLWSRSQVGEWVGPELLEKPATIELTGFGVSLDVGKLYSGVTD